MTSREYCDLSDLAVDQCHHCTINARTLGPAEFDDWIEDED